MVKKILDFLINGKLKAQDLEKVQYSLFAANKRSLLIFALLSAFACSMGTLGGLFSHIEVMKESLVGYIILLAINVLVIIINFFTKKEQQKIQSVLITVFSAPLYIFALYQAIFISPNDRPLILVVFLCLIPTIFIGSPFRLFMDFIATAIIYISVAPGLVPADQLGISIADIFIFGIAGIGIGLFFNKSRKERYLLAHQIEEMHSESEQMKYWKSISNIYISMNKVDIVNDTFVQIRSNEIFDAIIQNKHEGYSREINNVVKALVETDYVETVLQFVDPKTLQERLGEEETITYEFLSKTYGWCRARYIAVNPKAGEPLKQAMFLVESINEQKKREKLLTTIAETDGMTGLYNRRAGIPKIKKQLGLKTPGTLCLLDVDKFKHINDTYGHQVGDNVIIAVAGALKETFRDEDILLRLGGDEFLFFINGVCTEQVGCKIFNRLFDVFEKIVIHEVPDYKISVSIGAAIVREGLTFEELYSRADSGTYESKKVDGKAFTFFRG